MNMVWILLIFVAPAIIIAAFQFAGGANSSGLPKSIALLLLALLAWPFRAVAGLFRRN